MAGKSPITIKGVKEGLIFLLDDQCDFVTLLEELNAKLDKHVQQFTGPIVHVFVKLGSRQLNDEDTERLRSVLKKQGNLIVQSIESDPLPPDADAKPSLYTMTGMVRSGQTIDYDGTLVLLGDVNPGGTLRCTGDIYVLGALRGMAHAGSAGNDQAIIAASLMTPTQLRIADVISRPPDEWASADPWMEYAFLRDGSMAIDKLASLGRHRKEVMQFKGV
ncbi:septum site-determining protein MinC [Cohnella pontilimi]|uniref:Probable septum site-determining protein MinC n=1 Tax=Cohnella pontilimi TaxID=2564100 RepID=A0A4U0F9K0_9BACL|nr:septum site-determining protein MinC [Cohnella pontilimi]TJY41443.1 septum site-determining protein MinC [Cohnella pontilimi]